MKPQREATLRERFEKWALDHGEYPLGGLDSPDGFYYSDDETQAAWAAWQAASSAIDAEIEAAVREAKKVIDAFSRWANAHERCVDDPSEARETACWELEQAAWEVLAAYRAAYTLAIGRAREREGGE